MRSRPMFRGKRPTSKRISMCRTKLRVFSCSVFPKQTSLELWPEAIDSSGGLRNNSDSNVARCFDCSGCDDVDLASGVRRKPSDGRYRDRRSYHRDRPALRHGTKRDWTRALSARYAGDGFAERRATARRRAGLAQTVPLSFENLGRLPAQTSARAALEICREGSIRL